MANDPKLTRRQLFEGSGLALAGLAASACETRYPTLDKPPVPGAEEWTAFQEKVIPGACAQCPAGCGIRVRVVEGRAVQINGDPGNPINRGGIGPRGRSGVQVLYDPDRIRQPLRRKGPRGSREALEPVSWDEALEELAGHLDDLRRKNEPHRLGVICDRERGVMHELWQRFTRAYGTPNLFTGLSRRMGAIAQAPWLMQGVYEIPAYDWKPTRYVLSLGSGLLEATCQKIYFARATSHWKRGRTLDRARIVHVEPSRSRTGANADQWVSIAPGTYGAFALGLAHVLVRDEAYDRAFVEDHGFGFDDWTDEEGRSHRGFRQLLLTEYTPDRVAEICGIDARVVETIGAELASDRPAFAIAGPRATHAANGLHASMAVHALNALLGAIDRPGGVLVQREVPLGPWPEPELDDVAERGLAMPRLDGAGATRFPAAPSAVDALPGALLQGEPYGLDTLLFYYANPVWAWMAPEQWTRALAKVPFVVTFSPFLDETAAEVADLVLPDHTYLERWEDSAPAPSVGYPVFGVRRPTVEPLHDTRATGDVVIDLAKALEGPVAEAFPFPDFRASLLSRVMGIHQAGGGSIEADSPKEFLRGLFEDGFWARPEYGFEHWDEVLRTPSGRFEFFSQRLWRDLRAAAERTGKTPEALLREWGLPGDPDLACLPHHRDIPWHGSPDEYPVFLEPYRQGTYAEGSGANLPLLQELVTEPGHRPWTNTAEVHPSTAGDAGIRDGDDVDVESPAGRITLPVHVTPNARPGTIRIPRGGGHRAFGRFAEGQGANVMELLVADQDPLGGFPALVGTRVRIRRASS